MENHSGRPTNDRDMKLPFLSYFKPFPCEDIRILLSESNIFCRNEMLLGFLRFCLACDNFLVDLLRESSFESSNYSFSSLGRG